MGTFVKLAIASLDTHVGDFTGNLNKAMEAASRAAKKRASILLLPEMTFSGYPCEDMLLRPDFVNGQMRKFLDFVSLSAEIDPAAVYVVGVAISTGSFVYNCAAVVQNGKILGIVPKQKLPTYNVFYEDRTLSRGFPGQYEEIQILDWPEKVPFGDLIFKLPFGIFAVEVCEDGWSADGPAKYRTYQGALMVLNPSASPFRAGVHATRQEMFATRSSDYACVYVWGNKRGGQDDLVFDGGSLVFQNGRLILNGRRVNPGELFFAKNAISYAIVDLEASVKARLSNTTWKMDAREHLMHPVRVMTVESQVDPLRPSSLEDKPSRANLFLPPNHRCNPVHDYLRDMVATSVTGLEGYMDKVGFDGIAIGMSGGKDSALCLIIAMLYYLQKAKELGVKDTRAYLAEHIFTYSMPTRFNSDTTKGIAQNLALEVGASFVEAPIEEMVEVQSRWLMMATGHVQLKPMAKQNLQAVGRGGLMVDLTNEIGGLILLMQTGNMTEKAEGYTSIGGDILGGFGPIGNVPKSVIVNYLLQYLYKKFPFPSLGVLLETVSSAELAEGQTDERDLMPFDVSDSFYYLHVGEKLSITDTYVRVRQKFTDDDLRTLASYYDKDRREMISWYESGMLKAWLVRFAALHYRSVYKWVVSTLNAHQGSMDLNREGAQRTPVAMSPDWLKPELALLDSLPD